LVRSDLERGRWLAAGAAVFLSVAGCTLPNQQGGKSGNDKNVAIASPSPSPSPSPTTTQEFAVNGPAFHAGEVGVTYTPVVYTASGGTAPYQWTISVGALPGGLSLGGGGTVSGTPTASGKFSFTLHVADSGAIKADIPASITVAPALNASLIPACAKYCDVELGCVNACGNFGTQTGGVGPFTYNLSQGTLPSGTTLSALSLKGTFTGQTGYLQFTVQVTDSLGAYETVSPTFWMYAHISLSGGKCTTSFYAFGCSTSLPWSGGIGSPTVKVVAVNGNYCPPPNYTCQPATSPPPGFTAVVSGKNVNVSVAPAARPGFAYNGTVTLSLTDQSPCGSGSYCTTTANVAISIGLG
jgi:large repetitive protein